MLLKENHLYHIYNQGNNRQRVFFNHQNYMFFQTKMQENILPHAEIIAWCLMPNHFHMMVYVRKLELENKNCKTQSFNKSIGIMLSSYTRAIHIQENYSGSLFRKNTKAECLNCMDGPTPNFFGNKINILDPEKQYPQVCFDYIHNNPVKAGLVKNAIDWEYSSAAIYKGMNENIFIDKEFAREFVVY
jgi:putative transposase